MIDLFPGSKYEPHHLTFLSDMACKWFHTGTTLTLVEIHWYRNIRSSFHLLVEDQNGSSSTPVSLGINKGWDEIKAAVKQQIPPPELLRIILDNNPELENLVMDHSPNSQKLWLMKSATASADPKPSARTPLFESLGFAKIFRRKKSL